MTNTKTLLALLLSLALVVFIVRAVSVRRHGITWLEEIDNRITPLALEEIVGAPGGETPRPVASVLCEGRGVPSVVESSAAEETQCEDEVAHVRIGGVRESGVLIEVMRDAPPLPAYDAYLSLRELRGEAGGPARNALACEAGGPVRNALACKAGGPLSLEEFERCRTAVVDEYAAWLRDQNSRSNKADFSHPL